MIIKSETPEETMYAAAGFATKLKKGDLVLLSGDLGAGKTLFVKGAASALGIDPDQVTSPTFTLIHRYAGSGQIIHHLDLYRVRQEDRPLLFDWDELLCEGVVFVEWGEDLVIPDWTVKIESSGDFCRLIEISGRADEDFQS